jgi:hypothetical protein
MEIFTNVKVVLNEDLEKRPQELLRKIFRFLGVDTNCDVNTEIRYNVSGKPKSQWLHHFLFEENMARKLAQPIMRTFFPPETRIRIVQRMQEKNLTRMKINPDTKSRLHQLFEGDIQKLEALLGRDLSPWRK